MDHLAAAAHALRDPPARALALEQLVLAWREHDRHPDIAALVEALAAEITRALEPLDLTLADADFHTAWVARASRATLCDVDILLPGLFRGPLGKKIQQRFDLIVAFADDPRVSAAFGRMIEEPPVMAASNFSIWTRMFAALTRAPDIRLRPILERSILGSQGDSQFWPMLAQRSLALLRVLPERLPELEIELRERIASLRERIAELAAAPPAATADKTDHHARIEAELLAKIYAEPRVLEHRMVWADALQSRGDPRGEFVQLQLARAPNARRSKRERQLLAEFELLWLAEFGAAVDRNSVRWANGFPIAAEVVFDSRAQRELIGSAIWATFHELDCDDLELITSPTLRALERVGRLSLATLVALAEARGSALRIERLGPISLTQNPPAELDRLRVAAAERLADVRELHLHLRDHQARKRPSDFDWLLETPLGQRLTSFRLSAILLSHDPTNPTPWAEWAAVRTRWPRIERVRLDISVISLEMIDRQLIVRTQLRETPMSHQDAEARELIKLLRGHFDQLELISCGSLPLSEETAVRWAKAGGFGQFVHTHVRSDELISGNETGHALNKSEIRQRKAKGRIARAAKQTRSEPPPPRRYGRGFTGAWLACESAERTLYLQWRSQLAFTPDGRELLVLGSHLVGLSVPDLQHTWATRDGNRASPCSFAIEPTLQRAWFGAQNGATILWDLHAKRELAHSRFHRNRVSGVAILGERMFSADVDRTLHLWRYAPAQDGTEPITLVPDRSVNLDIHPIGMAIDPGGTTLALLGRDEVQWRDPNDPTRRLFTAAVLRATCLGWSPQVEGQVAHFVVGSEDGTISVWDLDGTQLTKLRVHHRRLGNFTWTPDGTRLITVGEDETGPAVHVIDCETGERVLSISPNLRGALAGVACSPDGRLLAASAQTVGCWSLDDGAALGRWSAT